MRIDLETSVGKGAGGIGEYLLGATTHQYGLSENNIILVFFIYVYVHLQHSQV